jgi:hypothetical protein
MSTEFDRHRFSEASGIAAAGVIAFAAVSQPVGAAQASSLASGRSPVRYQIKPMPFDPSHIKGMYEKILNSHCENNYAGAVTRLADQAPHPRPLRLVGIALSEGDVPTGRQTKRAER